MVKGRECDGCTFCCFAFGVHDIPDEIIGFKDKPALNHCRYECSLGCSIHNQTNYPSMCKSFICPYLESEKIHRPDTFQKILEELNGNIGNYIPVISSNMPIELVAKLIRKSRSIPAAITIGNQWIKTIMPLDREKDGTWNVTKSMTQQWKKFYQTHGEKFNSSIKNETKMI